MRSLIWVILFIVWVSPAYSATLAELIADCRAISGETDTAAGINTDADWTKFINLAQDKIVRLGGFIPKHSEGTVANSDSLGIVMPSDFRFINRKNNGLIYFASGQWHRGLENPGFLVDTNVFNYFIGWKTADTAMMYAKRGSGNTHTYRLFYFGTAADLDTLTDTCEVKEDEHVFIVEEAVSYYLMALHAYQVAAGVRSGVRQDMGIVKQ